MKHKRLFVPAINDVFDRNLCGFQTNLFSIWQQNGNILHHSENKYRKMAFPGIALYSLVQVPINNRVSRLLYRYDYNGSLIFLPVRQNLYYVRPNLDINSALNTLISVLLHIYMRILCVCILLLYQFQFLYPLCIWNKRKHPI